MEGNRELFPCFLHGAILCLTAVLGSFGLLGYLKYGKRLVLAFLVYKLIIMKYLNTFNGNKEHINLNNTRFSAGIRLSTKADIIAS